MSVSAAQASHILFGLLEAINYGPRNDLSGSPLPRNMKYRALCRFRSYLLLLYEMCFETTLNCISEICDNVHSLYEYHVRHCPCSEGYLMCICFRFRTICGRYIDRLSGTFLLFLMLVVTEYLFNFTIRDRKKPSNMNVEQELTQHLK
jgi:hypothetical protein